MSAVSFDTFSAPSMGSSVVNPDKIRLEMDIELESEQKHADYCAFLDQNLALVQHVSDLANANVDQII